MKLRKKYAILWFLIISLSLVHSANASVLFGAQTGATWALTFSAPGVRGQPAIPAFGFHGLFSISRRIKLRTYIEYQRFSLSPSSALLSGGAPNAALSVFLMPTYQMPTGALGATYIGLGGGVGFHPSFDDSLSWAVAAFGSEFGRKYFAEVRLQLKATGGSGAGLFDIGILVVQFGLHFNPRPQTWKESLIEEKR